MVVSNSISFDQVVGLSHITFDSDLAIINLPGENRIWNFFGLTNSN